MRYHLHIIRSSILYRTNGGNSQDATIQGRSLEVIDDKVISEALKNTCWTMIFTMLFGFGVLFWKGKKSAIEFLVVVYLCCKRTIHTSCLLLTCIKISFLFSSDRFFGREEFVCG